MHAPHSKLAPHMVLQDPSIKQMAEQIAQDPNFAQMAQAMQANMGGMAGAMTGGAPAPATPGRSPSAASEPNGVPGMPGIPGMAGGMPGGMDPAAYANMMSGVLQNPQFVEMAEKLGQQIMQVPSAGHVLCPAQNHALCHLRQGHLLLVCAFF